MSLTFVDAGGNVIQTADGDGPYQHTPEGFNTGLARNSVPLSQFGGGGSYANLYRTQPWVAVVVNKLTRQVARPPLKAYERNSQNEKSVVTSGRLYDLMRRPAKRRGPVQLKQWMSFPTLLHGNGPIQKMRKEKAGPPTSFRPLDYRLLTLVIDESTGEIDRWETTQFGKREFIDPADLVHFAWEGPDGILGVSPLKQLGVTIRIEQAAQTWQEATFRNSVRPSGGVTLPEDSKLSLDKEYRAELSSDLARMHAGGPNAGKPIVLPPGSTWQGFSATAHDAELIKQRVLAREEVAAVYDIPPPVIGILDNATYSNMDTIFEKVLFGPVLGPWFTLFEETFSAQVIDDEPAFEGQWVEFDLSEVLRGDPVKQATALKTQMSIGLLTINEARGIQNLPKIDHPSCDLPMIPANNLAFVGGEQTGDVAGQEVAGEIAKSLQRASSRAVRLAKAGKPAWDADRFHRELAEDLEAHGDHAKTADAWALATEAVVHETLSDPAALEQAFAALTAPLLLGAAA